jgi:hypothetical protein
MSYSYAISNTGLIDEDGEETQTRCVSYEEFIERIRNRRDIFAMESGARFNWTEGLCLTLAVLLGIWFDTRHIIPPPATDFISTKPPSANGTVKMVDNIIERLNPPAKAVPQTEKKVVIYRPRGNAYHSGTNHGGTGNPRSHVANMGIFQYVSNPIKGLAGTTGDPLALGGFADKLDAIISGAQALKHGGTTGSGRLAAGYMGFGIGIGPSGFDGGSGGSNSVNDLINSLINTSDLPINLKHTTRVGLVSEPAFTTGTGALIGGRSRESIMRTLIQNLPTLRYAYNRWLCENPGLKGKITVKFAIDEFGVVLHCEIINSFTDKTEINNRVAAIIKSWNFGKVDKPGDITEVVYPLVFSM